jgi:predicted Zn-dependent protease
MSNSPVLSPEALTALAKEVLHLTTADTMTVVIEHVATGIARVAQNRVRLNDSGDTLRLDLRTQFGQRVSAALDINQLDATSLRDAVAYLDRMAQAQPGDPASLAMPIPPRRYLPNTAWKETTVAAFSEARHTIVPALVQPLLNARLTVAAFAGVYVRSTIFADKQGLLATGQETDNELVVSGWADDGKHVGSGSGWAGQAARDWSALNPAAVGNEALRLTKLAANPVAFEPGRRTAILGRPAVAQLIHLMGSSFDADATLSGNTPLYNKVTRRPRLGEKIMDARISLSSDPNDPDGGYLPFNRHAYALVPMTWIEHGVLENLAFETSFAARRGITPANDAPGSLRMSGGSTTIEDMIAGCKEGVYVNRFSHMEGAGDGDSTSGVMTGVTSGGCFLIRNGKIEKSIKNLRFVESPWLFLNRVEAIGASERTAFGYAPWAGEWPIVPTIVPPLMIRDFNFTALADSV